MSMELRDEAGLRRARTLFLGAWLLLCALKLALAVRLPLFVDEAFYWQEGQHLALAYSDLPGLTAWLARLGVALGGNHPLALRLPLRRSLRSVQPPRRHNPRRRLHLHQRQMS